MSQLTGWSGLSQSQPVSTRAICGQNCRINGFPIAGNSRWDLLGSQTATAMNIGFAQEAKHDAEALCADADESDVNLVARWNVPTPAQHATRNDGKTHRGCGSLRQELAPRNWAF